MENTIKFESYLTNETHLHVADGNKKVGKGIYCINLLAGDEPLKLNNGTQLTNIPGTCKGCCDVCKGNCYAIKNQKMYNTNMPSWNDNTILATQDVETFFKEIQQFIDRSIVAVIRFHAFGEIPSYKYLEKMFELAENNPMIRFYTYTKRFDWLEKKLEENGDNIPNNLIINVSIWHNNYKNPYNLPEFVYDDGNEMEVSSLTHCPATDKNGFETGITCVSRERKCDSCYFLCRGNA